MSTAIITYLPWLLSIITVVQLWLAGSNYRNAWAIALANQALWLVWIGASGNVGFLPMNIALWVVYARNHLKWQEKAA
jgi:hypothetical protein